jgi:MFS superfamily sulfate permease-like transporter
MAGEERDSEEASRFSTITRPTRDGLWRKLQTNLKAKNVWQEASGSLGDIGTFVPLLLAMALVNGLDFGTTLVFTGLYNLVTGGLFGVPMPVQPMKSIAAVAITEGNPLTVPQIMAAGISTASLVLFLGATGLMGVVQRYVPLPVVRGIQVSQGISFGNTAVKYILKNQDFATSKATTSRVWFGYDGFVLAMGAISFVVVVSGAGARNSSPQPQQSAPTDVEEGGESSLEQPLVERAENEENELRPKGLAVIPSALIVFLVGVLIAIIRDPSVLKAMRFGPSPLGIVRISLEDWKTGFVRAAIPQIPLTILNSVVAVCKLSNDLLPRKKDVTPAAVSISVGVMNLVGCWFGAMPVCHGAGGLAGQYRFGARSGLSVAMLGTAKLVLGLVLGSSLLQLLGQFPIGLLGALLLFSGVELAMACRDQTSRLDAFVMLVVIVVSLGSSSAASGFGCGIGLWILIKIHEWSSESRYI